MRQVDPESVGLCSARLERLDAHLRAYVDDGRLPGWQVLITRQGRIAHNRCYGKRDVEAGKAVKPDTLFRIYSMTKPIVSVALMMLYERGLFQLDDPIDRVLPDFKDMQVFVGGDAENPQTVPAERGITYRDLLTHTAGLTYGFMQEHPVDALYRSQKLNSTKLANAEFVRRLGALPLRFQPGTRWSYSVATDVIGHLVEVLSGKRLDHFLEQEIFSPLGMQDTSFSVPPGQLERFAACYEFTGPGQFRRQDGVEDSTYREPPAFLSGGGGLVSSAADYARFCQVLLGGGAFDGVRLLGRKTVDLMGLNHLPTGGDLTSMGQPVFSETRYDGIGFGLGFSVVLDPAKAQVTGSPGELAWGGMASTAFWIDRTEALAVVFMTQLLPSAAYPLRRALRVLVNQALID
ncbi:MAG: hypothetical protein RLZZ174_148 [Pseudomonadota bacterium]